MEIFGILLAIPFAMVVSVFYSLAAGKVLTRYPLLVMPVALASSLVLIAIILEAFLVARSGALGVRGSIGPAFVIWHVIGFFLSAPAASNLILIICGRRWYLAAVAAFVMALFCLFFNIHVSEKLHGIDGVGGPYSSKELPNNGVNPTAGGASLLRLADCHGGGSVDGVGPPAAGYTER